MVSGTSDLAHDRLGGRGELCCAVRRRGARRPVPAALGRVPAGGALHVAAGLDGAALDALVLPDLDLLGLLRRLSSRLPARPWACAASCPACAEPARLASAGFCSVSRRPCARAPASRRAPAAWRVASSSCLSALLLAQLGLARVDRRRRRQACASGRRRRARIVALDENALLLDLDLDGARLAARVGLLDDLGGLLARQRDLVLRLGRAVRPAQVVEELGLVLLREDVLGDALVHAGRAQLLEQLRGLDLQLACELRNARLCHGVRSTPASNQCSRAFMIRLLARSVSIAVSSTQVVEREVGEVVARLHARTWRASPRDPCPCPPGRAAPGRGSRPAPRSRSPAPAARRARGCAARSPSPRRSPRSPSSR